MKAYRAVSHNSDWTLFSGRSLGPRRSRAAGRASALKDSRRAIEVTSSVGEQRRSRPRGPKTVFTGRSYRPRDKMITIGSA